MLIGAAIGASALLGTPNFGLGPAIDFSSSAFVVGALYVAPLVLLAVALDWVEEQVPALKDVTKATQRSVLALMGGRFKPLFAIMVSVVLGTIAGFGEEMLFRGVFQYEVASQFGIVAGVAISSLVFGLLHAVTPLYAVLATLASIYFGSIYVLTENLAIAITCHAVYDIGALFYAHWTVSKLSLAELQELAFWRGPETDA